MLRRGLRKKAPDDSHKENKEKEEIMNEDQFKTALLHIRFKGYSILDHLAVTRPLAQPFYSAFCI